MTSKPFARHQCDMIHLGKKGQPSIYFISRLQSIIHVSNRYAYQPVEPDPGRSRSIETCRWFRVDKSWWKISHAVDSPPIVSGRATIRVHLNALPTMSPWTGRSLQAFIGKKNMQYLHQMMTIGSFPTALNCQSTLHFCQLFFLIAPHKITTCQTVCDGGISP